MDFINDIIKNCDSIVSAAKYMYACLTDMEISIDDKLREEYSPALKSYLEACRKMRTDLIACFGMDNPPAEPEAPEIESSRFHIKNYKENIFDSDGNIKDELLYSLERTKATFSLRQMLCGRGETILNSLNCIEDIYNCNKDSLPLEKAIEVVKIVSDPHSPQDLRCRWSTQAHHRP